MPSTQTATTNSTAPSERPVRIVHLTDTHTTSLAKTAFAALLSKRALGYLSWRRKRRHRHTQHMLKITTEEALTHRPDAVVITGDLLHIGLAHEMRQIRPWLSALAERQPVLLVPGNHDLYAANSLQHWQKELGDLPVFGTPLLESDDWPRVMQVKGIRVLGLNSAYPAPLTRADGKLGEPQRERLIAALQQPDSNTNATLLALHHPAEPNLAAERKSLLDAPQLKQLMHDNAEKITALVHGHLHQNISYRVGRTPCYCTASASSTTRLRQSSNTQNGGHSAESQASFRLLEFSATKFQCRLFKANSENVFIETREPD